MEYLGVFAKEFGSNGSLPSGWSYVFSPVVLLSCLVTLTCAYVIMPAVGPCLISKYDQLKENKKSFNTILGSNIHHVLVSLLAFYALISGAITDRIFSNSALGFALMQLSLGYFIGDTLLMLFNPKVRTSANMFHHLMGILGFTLALTAQGRGMFFPISFQLVEFSSVFMNLQRAMSMAGISRDSRGYVIISHVVVASYFVTRICIIPWHWYEIVVTLLHPASNVIPLHFKIYTFVHFTILHSLFLYWFPQIVRKTYYYRKSVDKQKVH